MSASKPDTLSPCISICSLDDDTGFCRGCYRTGSEVEGWARFKDEQKKAVLEALRARKAQYPELGAR